MGLRTPRRTALTDDEVALVQVCVEALKAEKGSDGFHLDELLSRMKTEDPTGQKAGEAFKRILKAHLKRERGTLDIRIQNGHGAQGNLYVPGMTPELEAGSVLSQEGSAEPGESSGASSEQADDTLSASADEEGRSSSDQPELPRQPLTPIQQLEQSFGAQLNALMSRHGNAVSAKDAAERRAAELEAANAQLQAELLAAKRTSGSLTERNSKLGEGNRTLAAQVTVLSGERDEATAAAANATEELKAAQEQIGEFQAEVTRCDTKCTELEEKLRDCEAERAKAERLRQEQYQQHEAEVAELRQRLEEKDAAHEAYKAEMLQALRDLGVPIPGE